MKTLKKQLVWLTRSDTRSVWGCDVQPLSAKTGDMLGDDGASMCLGSMISWCQLESQLINVDLLFMWCFGACVCVVFLRCVSSTLVHCQKWTWFVRWSQHSCFCSKCFFFLCWIMFLMNHAPGCSSSIYNYYMWIILVYIQIPVTSTSISSSKLSQTITLSVFFLEPRPAARAALVAGPWHYEAWCWLDSLKNIFIFTCRSYLTFYIHMWHVQPLYCKKRQTCPVSRTCFIQQINKRTDRWRTALGGSERPWPQTLHTWNRDSFDISLQSSKDGSFTGSQKWCHAPQIALS